MLLSYLNPSIPDLHPHHHVHTHAHTHPCRFKADIDRLMEKINVKKEKVRPGVCPCWMHVLLQESKHSD